ncbi:MAG: PP2C family protein-serine/threonine phosphatase [Planctomycetota bacterium]|jgi:PAS domain S-box-containing protein
MDSSGEGITIADARLPDMPIVYANAAFVELTGYSLDDVIGHNCRFLQGPETDPAEVDKIRSAIRDKQDVIVELVNYRKNGSPFWNRLRVTPVLDASGCLTHFIGVQSDITRRVKAERELQEANTQLESLNERMRKEMDAAAKIQRSLLPQDEIKARGVQTAWAFRPCTELAGDSFHLCPINDEFLAVYILDVVGHGACAALEAATLSRRLTTTMGVSSLLLKEDSHTDTRAIVPPAEVLKNLNTIFFAEALRGQFYTILYGLLHLESGLFRYASAGHPNPVLIRQSGDTELLESSGFPIGYFNEADYVERTAELASGDRLYCYTDGIVEAGLPGNRGYGETRLVEHLEGGRHQPLKNAVSTLIEDVVEWCGQKGPGDDVSIVAIEYTT